MQNLGSLLTKEKQHFNRLNRQGRKLILSIFLFNLIGPLFGVFLNAFLWRQTQNVSLVAIFNLISFLTIPIGFYLNAYALRRFTPAMLYIFGLGFSGASIGILVFLPALTFSTIVIFGFICGISGGFFWANRNLLTLKTTQSENRLYFSSLESASTNIAEIIIPFCIGWFILLGAKLHWYSALRGYQLLIGYMCVVVIVFGLIVKDLNISVEPFTCIFLRTKSIAWRKFRFLEFILGLLSGMSSFVPTLMVLTLLGHENALGTVQSLSAIIGAISIYSLGKLLHTRHRIKIFQTSFLLELIGTGLFSLLYSGVGVLLFFAFDALASPFSWIASSSLNYDLIDDENKSVGNHYANIFDQEIYLNAGRAVSIICFLGFASFISKDFALRFSPLLFAFLQLILLFLVKSIEK